MTKFNWNYYKNEGSSRKFKDGTPYLLHEKNLDLYLELALERQAIYVKKLREFNKPWTINPIFQKYFFCNVFREQDKVSVWIIHNIIKKFALSFKPPLRNSMIGELLPILAVYRYINYIPTFNFLVGTFDIKLILKCLLTLKKEGKKIFNSAFINNSGSLSKLNYIKFLYESINEPNFKAKLKKAIYEDRRMEAVCDVYKSIDGVGGFMAYEYACDISYMFLKDHFKDINTWANVGPGCRKGIAYILRNIDGTRLSKKYDQEAQQIIRKHWEPYMVQNVIREPTDPEYRKYLSKLVTPEMRVIEMWLCEFQKYKKYEAKELTGRLCKFRKYN